jgi:hypothetical protein
VPGMFYRICLFKTKNWMSIFSETVCDKGATFLRNRSSDNIESNTKTLFNEKVAEEDSFFGV